MQTTEREQKAEKGGIRLSRFHALTAIVIALLAAVLLLSTYLTSRGYARMQEATERYITAQQAAADMQAASEYLTTEARAFIVTGAPERAERFFEEASVTRRRDKALEDIQKLLGTPSAYAYLSKAMDSSNALLEIEYYAMRLAAESYDIDPGGLPAPIAGVALKAGDLLLSAEQQRDKALLLLFDETYQSYKNDISGNVSRSVETLIDETRSEQMNSADRLLRQIRREEILIVVLLLLALVLVVSTAILVTKPLRDYISHIRRGEKLPETGASELRFLAQTYNQVQEQNQRHREQLSYDATHDALTGVFNRSVFEKLRSRCTGGENTMLIVDLDHFKSINDQYGHDIGDQALCYVAALLQSRFRAEDYICRIGGDEFVVIMVRAGSAQRELIREKIRALNEVLKTPRDGLPPISLSVGVAFGDRENPTDDIFKDADTALYRAKNSCRGGCEFY